MPNYLQNLTLIRKHGNMDVTCFCMLTQGKNHAGMGIKQGFDSSISLYFGV